AAQRLNSIGFQVGGDTGAGQSFGPVGIKTPGAFASLGAGGLLLGGGLLGGLAGGSSPIGRFLGSIGGTLGAGVLGATGIFGSGIASALPALFSNPITAIVAGALIGGAFLTRLFKHDYLKDYRKLIQGEYAIDVKSKQLLETIKQIGQQKYGKAFGKHEIETVRLSEVRDLLVEYAQATGQRGNSKLYSTSALQDPFNEANRFIVRRELGGFLAAGQAALV